MGSTWPKEEVTKRKIWILFWIQKNEEFSEGPFQCIFNEFGFLLDVSSKINLHVWFYFIIFLTILYITLETGHMESSVLLSLSASCSGMYKLLIVVLVRFLCVEVHSRYLKGFSFPLTIMKGFNLCSRPNPEQLFNLH